MSRSNYLYNTRLFENREKVLLELYKKVCFSCLCCEDRKREQACNSTHYMEVSGQHPAPDA